MNDATDRLIARLREAKPSAEMVQGYRDGFDRDAPEPSENRSHSYRHGFANARDDLAGSPRASVAALLDAADAAEAADLARTLSQPKESA